MKDAENNQNKQNNQNFDQNFVAYKIITYENYNRDYNNFISAKNNIDDNNIPPKLSIAQIKEIINLEVKIMETSNHPNIIKFKSISFYDDEARLIMEYGGINLDNCDVNFVSIKVIMKQVLLGLNHLHKKFIHRDLTPSNILINPQNVVKIIDFSNSIEIENNDHFYTTSVYYVSPEMILGSLDYSTEIDIWAVGCILVELYRRCMCQNKLMSDYILFQERTDKLHLEEIFSILGTPSLDSKLRTLNCWSSLKPQKHYFPDLDKLLIKDDKLLNLVVDLLSYDNRPTAIQASKHEYFN
jgi:serine/threonine protein kinase